MTICKFFLQGTCRFGENCKFEHQINTDHNYGAATSALVHSFGNKPTQVQPQGQGGTNVDTNTLVKSVMNDMTQAEKGGQWLLSTYAPFKEKPEFPGFEDLSMEEARFQFYEAAKNGTVEQFKQNLQMMLQQAAMKIKALQNPSPDAVNMLKNIYNTVPTSGFQGTSQTSPVFGAPAQSVFGNGAGGVFASGLQQKSVFGSGGSSSVFGAQNSTGNTLFGGGAQNSSSVFGKSVTSSVFGAQNSGTTSIFGSAPNSSSSTIFGASNTATNSVFGAQKTQTSQVFGQSAVFGSQTNTTPVFGSPQTSTNSVFGSGSPQTSTIFGAQPTSTSASVFGSPQNNPSDSIFGAVSSSSTNRNSVFGNTATSIFGAPPNTNSASIFGAPATSPTSSVFGAAPVFGGTPQTTTTRSMFGVPPANSVFGTNSSSVFGTTQTTTTNSVFSPAPTSTTNSVFGAAPISTHNSVFGAAPSSPSNSVFGTPQTGATSPAFGAAASVPSPFSPSPTGTTSPVFGASKPVFGSPQFGAVASPPAYGAFGQPGIFGGQAPQSPQNIFQQQLQPPSNVFTSQQPQTAAVITPQGHSASIFGNLVPQTAPAEPQFQPSPEFYSKIEELTKEALEWFQSDDLDIMKIPELPPPYELCFKS